nr:defensin D2-like [Tanacetum cinerariifolium]
MDRSVLRFFACLSLITILIVSEMGSSTAKGKQSCKYASNTYKGLCFFNRNCDIICKAEGAPSGGRCRILTLRCICNVCDPD